MKMKKFLALLLAAIMLCSLFAVAPVSAAENANASIFGAYEAEKHHNWWQPATKEGHDGFITVNSTYAVYSKQAYDMETHKVVISDLNVNSTEKGYLGVLMFAPAAANGCYDYYNGGAGTEDSLVIAFLQDQFDENGNPTRIRISTLDNPGDSTQANGISSYFTKKCGNQGFYFYTSNVDRYEFSFFKKMVKPAYIDEDTTEVVEAEYLYGLKINDYYITGDENSRLAKFYNSGTVYNSVVSLSAQNKFEANVDITEADTFVSTNGKTGTLISNNDDGSQTVLVRNENDYRLYGDEVATTAKHDLTKDMFTIKNIAWYNSTSSTILVNFSSANRYGEGSKKSFTDAEESVLGFRIQKYHATTYTTSFSMGEQDVVGGEALAYGGVNHTGKMDIGLPTEIKISFLEENGVGYIIINGRCVTNEYVSNFVTSGGAEDCYISISAHVSATIDVDVEERDYDWAATYVNHNFNALSTDSEGNTIYFNHYNTNVATYDTVDFDNNLIDLYNITPEYHASSDDAHIRLILTFSTSHQFGNVNSLATDTANGRLMLNLFFEEDGIWVQHQMNATTPSESNNLAKVPLSDEYKIAVREINGDYAVYVNDTEVKSNHISNYFAANYDNSYVTLSTRTKKMYYSADIYNYENSSEFTFSDVDVAPEIVDSTIVNVSAFSTPESFGVNAADGYTVTVTDKNGNTVNDDFVASGDKVTINYKGWFDVVSYDLIVIADTNGDRAFDGIDLTNIRKELLGNPVEGVYKQAMNVCYDGEINIIDLVVMKKDILAEY